MRNSAEGSTGGTGGVDADIDGEGDDGDGDGADEVRISGESTMTAQHAVKRAYSSGEAARCGKAASIWRRWRIGVMGYL